MMVGIAIAYLLPVFLNLVLANILKSVAFAIYIRANVAIGFILYFASFGGSKTFGLFNRQQAERAIIINENGLPLYSYNFKNAEGKIDSALFAGGIVAISQLMKEATKSQAAITELKMEDETHLLIEVKPKILAILLTPKVTIFLRDTIKRFATRFSEKFESKLDDFEIVETSIFSPEGTKMLYESLGIPQP
jgi:predicted regulator of Ras-like GTPase activity (Roadblock/LC7/MglB family)